MSMQQYCLRWNNHQPNFISVFSSLLNSESLVDVTLAAEGKHLQAHKVVLSACSSYFQSLFTINPCQHPIVILKDVKFLDLKVIVDFMYYGEVNVSQEQLPYILKTAEMLKIKGLAEIPVEQTISKSHNVPTEKTELLTPADSNWSSEGCPGQSSTPSPCPLSPASRRKRLRKSSTGSGSGSADRTFDEPQHPSEVLLTTTAATTVASIGSVIKSDPSSFDSSCSLSHKNKQLSNDSELHRGSSHESIESEPVHQITLQVPQQQQDIHLTQSLENASVEVPGTSSSSSTQHSISGIQWNIVDHSSYAQYTTSCTNNPPSTENNPSQSHHLLNSNQNIHSPQNASNNNNSAPCYPNHVITNSPPQMMQNKRKRSVNPQADENFIRALEAVRFGGIGFCKAARMYGVNNRTLWLEYKKRGYPNFRISIKNRKSESQNDGMNAQSPSNNGSAEHALNNPVSYHTNSSNGGTDNIKQDLGEQSNNSNEQMICASNHPVALISGTFFEQGKHVDLGQVLHHNRPKYLEGTVVSTAPQTMSYQSINFEQM